MNRFGWLKVAVALVPAVLLAWLPLLGANPLPPPGEKEVKPPAAQRQVLRAGRYSANKKVAPPAAALAALKGTAKVTAKIDVTFTGFDGDEGKEAKKAFQAAVTVWGALLKSPVTIRVQANWTPLDPGVLGSAGPNDFRQDFANAPKKKTWYPIALANKLAGQDLTPNEPHIVAEFSSVFDNWYRGTDQNTPADKYDLMSVILHELGHGLGFIGSMRVKEGKGSWGSGTAFPFIYDRFTENELKEPLLNTQLFPNPSTLLAGQLTSNHVFWNGPLGVAALGGTRPRLYTPLTWEDGSSYSHLDETSFPAGDVNSLMTPQIGMGEAVHRPGPVGLAMLKDMGW